MQVLDFEEQHGVQALSSEQYHGITNGIFNQHRGTMLDVAKGVFEFNEASKLASEEAYKPKFMSCKSCK